MSDARSVHALQAAPAIGMRAASRTDPGRVRTNNEDVPLLDAERGIFGVIDGVGGQAAGEFAASIAYDVILQRLARPLGTPAERVREAIALANNEIFKRAGDDPDLHGMTCVVTLAIVSGNSLTIGHVGDSRLYKVRPGGIRKLTHDHSPVGEREDAQEITEPEAMRHPRRNEVFRDVGSAYRDKDEDEYVEVIEETLEPDAAILLCTDGLTDMIPSAVVEHVIRRYAGSPEGVAAALVDAANAAGGKDNVSVVYAEAPEFARAVRARGDEWRTEGTAADADHRGGGTMSRPHESPAGRRERRSLAGRIANSRVTWFLVGLIAGVSAAVGIGWRLLDPDAPGRTLIVGPDPATAYQRIGDAIHVARPGDTVRVEPGVYRERVLLPPGVSLVARLRGTATLARGAGSSGQWTAIAASGDLTGRIAGFRIESTPELPVDVGVRLDGQGWTLELMEFTGPMQQAAAIGPGSAATVNGCQFSVAGTALSAADRALVTLSGNNFFKNGRPGYPISLGPAVQANLRGNLFAGFGVEIVKGVSPAERQQIVAANVIITAGNAP
jgi:PPM family protein phosphatase